MSERGVFAIDRGIWDDVDFADETYSEREAFMWLVGQAAWRPTRVRIGSAAVDLARGQCAFSTRFLAAKWKWSEARIRRYLSRLKKCGIIDAHSDARATTITLCKYDRFQRVSLPTDAQAVADATQERRSGDAPPTQQRRKEEDRETKEVISSSLRSEPRVRERRKALTSVDPDWRLSGELIAAAENCGLSREQAIAEWPRFIDHALKNDAKHRDWVAAWRSWCRSPYRKAGPPPRQPPRKSGNGFLDALRDEYGNAPPSDPSSPFDPAGALSSGDARSHVEVHEPPRGGAGSVAAEVHQLRFGTYGR